MLNNDLVYLKYAGIIYWALNCSAIQIKVSANNKAKFIRECNDNHKQMITSHTPIAIHTDWSGYCSPQFMGNWKETLYALSPDLFLSIR